MQSTNPTGAVFSPDGRWVAYYYSNEAGTRALWAQPFPATGARYEISTDGDSHHPLWSPDGKQLFYVTGPDQFVSRSIRTQPSFERGNAVRISIRQLLLRPPFFQRNFDVTPDGKIVGTILATSSGQPEAGTPTAPQIHVVLNWLEELKRLVPTR